MSKPPSHDHGLRREASAFGLIFASLGGIIGSGWLFGPLNAAKAAGPASLLAWAIGGGAIVLLAFVYAELATSFPRAGADIALPKLSHGRLLATIMSWIVLLGYLTAAPTEATATVSYADAYAPGLIGAGGVLTAKGFGCAAGLLLLFALINTLAVRLVLRFHAALTIVKVAVPLLTAAALIAARFTPANFHSHGFAPRGFDGVFSAVATSGVIYAFTGFQQAVQLAGESRNPGRDLPIAILGSVAIGFAVYAAVQFAFIGALDPKDLARGWGALRFAGAAGPFAGLAALLGMTWLAVVLYIDSALSPAGTAIIALASTPRLLYAIGREGIARGPFAKVSKSGAPIVGVAIAFVAGIIFLLPAPSWRALIRIVSSAALLSYGMTSVSLVALRRSLPPALYPRPFRLAFAIPVAALAFVVANFIIVWTGARTADVMMSYVLVCAVLFFLTQTILRRSFSRAEWRGALWLAPYFAGLWLLTQVGPQSLTGGDGLLSSGALSATIAVFSLAILWLAAICGLADPQDAKASLAAHAPTAKPADAIARPQSIA